MQRMDLFFLFFFAWVAIYLKKKNIISKCIKARLALEQSRFQTVMFLSTSIYTDDRHSLAD